MFSGKPLPCHLLLTSFRLSCLYVSVKTWITDPSSGFCLVKKKHPFILATSFISPFISPFFLSHMDFILRLFLQFFHSSFTSDSFKGCIRGAAVAEARAGYSPDN